MPASRVCRSRNREESAGLDAEILEALVEAGELAAGVEQAMLAAGPGRVRLRIDIEPQRVAGFAVGRACLIGAAIGHHDSDLVIIRVDLVLHRFKPQKASLAAGPVYSGAGPPLQSV